MDATTQFIIFGLFGVFSLLLGVTARHRGWLHEDASRHVHLVTLVGPWSAAALLTLWRLPIDLSNVWLLLIQPIMVAAPVLLTVWLGRHLTTDRQAIGVLAIAAALGNTGFTLGAYLCFTLLGDRHDLPLSPNEADQGIGPAALAYGVAIVTLMSVAAVLILFPIARLYAASPGDTPSMDRLIVSSFFDIRAALLWSALVGVILAASGVPYPVQLDRFHTLDILFYLGAFTAYTGIGLRLRLGDNIRQHWRLHAGLAGVKFFAIPAVAVATLLTLRLAPASPSKLLEHVVIIEAFMPVAIQGVIIPNLFGLDARLASSLWLINTLIFAVLVLPVLMLVV